MKKNELLEKKVALIGLAATLAATSLSVFQNKKTTGMKEAEGEPIYYVQDANEKWYAGLDVRVFNYEKNNQNEKILTVLYGGKEEESYYEAYYRNLSSPEEAIVITKNKFGRVIDIKIQTESDNLNQNEDKYNLGIVSSESFPLTESLTYENVLAIEEELNSEFKRK